MMEIFSKLKPGEEELDIADNLEDTIEIPTDDIKEIMGDTCEIPIDDVIKVLEEDNDEVGEE